MTAKTTAIFPTHSSTESGNPICFAAFVCMGANCFAKRYVIYLHRSGVALLLYSGSHNHDGPIQSTRQRHQLSEPVKARSLELLADDTVSAAWVLLLNEAQRAGLTAAQIDGTMPTYQQLIHLKQSKLKALKSFAELESLRILQAFPKENGVFVLDMSFYHEGQSEIFVLLATTESLHILVKHGQNLFFMDGMHKVNTYANNQVVTINVRVGSKGFPCAYLITSRYSSTIVAA